MYLSTFKRNWILHYIKPEFLYLPRGKRDSYKEDHIEVEKKPGYMVIILRYRTSMDFDRTYTPPITVIYFLRKTKHGTLEDTYFSTQESQSEDTKYKKITYDEEGTKHVEEVSAKSYTATASQSLTAGSISYPADGEYHDIIIYVPEPVEDYEFGYCELRSTMTNVHRTSENITPAKYNRISDVILTLDHSPAYLQFDHRNERVSKAYSALEQIVYDPPQIYSDGNFQTLQLLDQNNINSNYTLQVWKDQSTSYILPQFNYLIEPDNNGNLSLTTGEMYNKVINCADNFPTRTISVFLYDIVDRLDTIDVPTTMDVVWATLPYETTIVNSQSPGNISKIPIYNHLIQHRIVEGDLYKLSDQYNTGDVVISDGIVYEVQKNEQSYTFYANEDPEFTHTYDPDGENDKEDGLTMIVLKDGSSIAMNICSLQILEQGETDLGYGGYYEESFYQAKVTYNINEYSGTYQPPAADWPVVGNPRRAQSNMWPPTSSAAEDYLTQNQFITKAKQAGFSAISFDTPSGSANVRWIGEIINMTSPSDVSHSTIWGLPWYSSPYESTIDFSRRYSTGAVTPSQSPTGTQGQYALHDLNTRGVSISNAYYNYSFISSILWDSGRCQDILAESWNLAGTAYEGIRYFSESAEVITFEVDPVAYPWNFFNTASRTANPTLTAGTFAIDTQQGISFQETGSFQPDPTYTTLTKKEKANLKLINKTMQKLKENILNRFHFTNPLPPHDELLYAQDVTGFLYFNDKQTNYSLTDNVDSINDFTWNTKVSYYNLFNTNNPNCETWIAHGNNNNNNNNNNNG